MIEKTRNYDQFVFADDNREKGVEEKHVQSLVKSIETNNLLRFRPITVTKDMQIIDGQHRLMAAKLLGVEVYYQIVEKPKAKDIILLNNLKPWGTKDYLHFYVKNGYPEYIKLNEFIKKANIPLSVALTFCFGSGRGAFKIYKDGEIKFNIDIAEEDLNEAQESIDAIRIAQGGSSCLFVKGIRFWKALLCLIRQPEYTHDKWLQNLKRYMHKIVPKVRVQDYCQVFMEIHNTRNPSKVNLKAENYDIPD